MTEPRGAIYLVARAPLDISYQHTIDFLTEHEQFQYWQTLTKFTLRDYSYIRRERRFVQVDKSFDDLDDINYLYFVAGPAAKVYYCFVTDREYVNDNSTRIYFEIDVMQTYLFDYKFQPSFITQAHVDRWDANHKPIYSKTDEGLNYGSEYVTEAAYRLAPALPSDPEKEDGHGFYLVYMSDTKSYETTWTKPTEIANNPIPYHLYLLIANENYGSRQITQFKFYDEVVNQWGTMSSTTISQFQQFLANSAYGEYVKHIVYVPYLPFDYVIGEETSENVTQYTLSFFHAGDDEITASGLAAYFTSVLLGTAETGGAFQALRITKIVDKRGSDAPRFMDLAAMPRESGIELAIPSEEMFETLKANPWTTEFDRRFQSKLLCYPYRYNVFTDWNNAPALIKNEYMTGDEITVKMSMGFGFNVPRRFFIADYRGDPEGRESGFTQAIPADQPIISDAYYTYLLQNKNQISANITNAAISAATATASGAVSGAVSGAGAGPVGAIAGAVTGGVKAGLNGALTIQAKIRSENAKQADLKNLPDTITSSNECSFLISDGSKYVTFYRKKIACEYEDQLAQYWHMYGYKVNRLAVPNIRSRVRFNFIKTIGANIVATGDIDATNIATIKAIFDNGITFWHCRPEEHAGGQYDFSTFKPLDYTFENPEVSIV